MRATTYVLCHYTCYTVKSRPWEGWHMYDIFCFQIYVSILESQTDTCIIFKINFGFQFTTMILE